MKNKTIWLLGVFFLLISSVPSQGVREAVWAGQFYEADAGKLSDQIDEFLGIVGTRSVRGEIKALIVPHAGYQYSGQTAAYAYNAVQGKSYDAVVIIGPSHYYGFEGCSIYPKAGFKTPLGTAVVDEALAAQIAKRSGFGFVPKAHEKEHSVEVEVPFIQKALPGIRIVPIVIGVPEKRTIQTLAAALDSACAEKSVLVVASTDMSHYLTKNKANAVDAATIELIKSLDADAIIRKMEAGDNILCGGAAVAAAILYAKKLGPVRAEILNYRDSSEATGDESRVVGYMAAALVSGQEDSEPAFDLSAEEKKGLLELAKTAVEEFIAQNKVVRCTTQNPKLLENKGAFVTLKKNGDLRGCIGFIEPVMSLCQTIIQTAIYAATEDPRFQPVREEELNDLEYEISVLTPLRDVTDPSLINVGTHGLVIEKEGRKGLLLPQVPVENGWDRETFLEQTCLKAGLPCDAWKKGAKISSFEAIVFH